jgi:hypothetical protein
MGRHALQEIHSALSAPSSESQRLGRSGCLIKGRDSDTKSAALEFNTWRDTEEWPDIQKAAGEFVEEIEKLP